MWNIRYRWFPDALAISSGCAFPNAAFHIYELVQINCWMEALLTFTEALQIAQNGSLVSYGCNQWPRTVSTSIPPMFCIIWGLDAVASRVYTFWDQEDKYGIHRNPYNFIKTCWLQLIRFVYWRVDKS